MSHYFQIFRHLDNKLQKLCRKLHKTNQVAHSRKEIFLTNFHCRARFPSEKMLYSFLYSDKLSLLPNEFLIRSSYSNGKEKKPRSFERLPKLIRRSRYFFAKVFNTLLSCNVKHIKILICELLVNELISFQGNNTDIKANRQN